MVGIEFSVLGPVEARRDGVAIGLGGPQQRRLLAVFLTSPRQTLTLDRLAEAMWAGDQAPEGARRTLFTYVSRLRIALGDGYVLTQNPGYAVDPGSLPLDSAVFEGLLASARSAAPSLRLALLDQALGLWRGPAFGEFAGEWWARPVATRLDELRLVATEDRVDTLLELGQTEQAVSEAEGFAVAYPLRERPVAQLARALASVGRQADAMRTLHSFRSRLVDETGLEPSASLADLESSIAAGESVSATAAHNRQARGYVLGDVLGEGSFGTVYRATQPGIGREVAVKVVRSEHANNPAFVQRFEAEAQLVARLEHPHIVPLHDFWREPGGAYLVFRLMRGGSAEQSLATDGAWPLGRVTQLVEQVGAALAAAHAQGVVHRDVKPANVLFDTMGNAHLADFGVATADADAAGSGLYSARSPMYVAPEQFQRRTSSSRSDIYSLAAMVWELLSGEAPFDGESASTIAPAKLERPVPPLHGVRPDVASRLDPVLQKATAPDATERFRDVNEFVLAWRAAVNELRPSTSDGPLADGTASSSQPAPSSSANLAASAPNPYKGLRSFTEADARDFHGREDLANALTAAVSRSRVTMVVGASGAGKSSLLHAGLLPRLRSDGARIVTMVPTDGPCAQLRTALLTVALAPLAAKLEQALPFVADEAPSEFVLVVDQFEEVWTLAAPDERNRFIALLHSVITDRSLRARVVFGIRADFVDRPLSDPMLGPLVAPQSFLIAPMTSAEIAAAVRAPANAVGVSFEPGLDAEIVAEVANQSASLPMLQFALAELYERREGAVIPTSAYRAMGGVAGAVAARAESLHAELDSNSQDNARRLFTRLVTPGAGAEDTRRRVNRSALPEHINTIADAFVAHRLLVVDRDPATREPTLDIAHEALLTRWPRLRGWLDDNREQLQQLQHLTRAAEEWSAAGRRNSDLYRGPRLALLDDIDTVNAAILTPTETDFLDASRKASEEEQRSERQRIARLRRALTAAALALVVAITAGTLALVQRNKADDRAREAAMARDDATTQAVEAERQTELARSATDDANISRLIAQSRADAQSDSTRALLLAVEAYKRRPNWQTAGAVQSVLVQQPTGVLGYLSGKGPFGTLAYGKSVLVGRDGDALAVWNTSDYRRIRTISDAIIAEGDLSLSADDAFVAVFNAAGILVFDVAAGKQLAKLSYESAVTAIAFDPADSQRLAVGRADGSVEMVRWRTSAVDFALPRSSARVDEIAFDRLGRRLAVATRDVKGRVFDVATRSVLVVVDTAAQPAPGQKSGIALSPSGDNVATFGGFGGSLRAFRVRDGAMIFARDSEVRTNLSYVRLSDDTTAYYGGGQADHQAVDISTGVKVKMPIIQGISVAISAAVSPDGATVALVAANGIALFATDGRVLGEVRNVVVPEQPTAVQTPQIAYTFNHDGTQLLASVGAAYLFDLTQTPARPRKLEFPGGPLWIARFDPTGRFIDTVHIDFIDTVHIGQTPSTFQRWNPSTLQPIGAPVALPGWAAITAVSDDGKLLAAADFRESLVPTMTLRVFDIASGSLLRTFTDLDRVRGTTEPGAFVGVIAFSDDSRQVAAQGNSAVAVWDLVSGAATVVARRDARALDFDPSGQWLVVYTNGEIKRLDVASGATTLSMTGRGSSGFVPAFSPDTSSSLLRTDGGCVTSNELTPAFYFPATQLWDMSTGQEIGVGFHFTCAAWSRDGKQIVGNSFGRRLSIWTVDREQWRDTACRAAGRNLTEEEWKRYVSSIEPYRATCG